VKILDILCKTVGNDCIIVDVIYMYVNMPPQLLETKHFQFFILNHPTFVSHCLGGNSHITQSTFQPFSTRKTLINALSSEAVACACRVIGDAARLQLF